MYWFSILSGWKKKKKQTHHVLYHVPEGSLWSWSLGTLQPQPSAPTSCFILEVPNYLWFPKYVKLFHVLCFCLCWALLQKYILHLPLPVMVECSSWASSRPHVNSSTHTCSSGSICSWCSYCFLCILVPWTLIYSPPTVYGNYLHRCISSPTDNESL